ncbi:MAG TPA: hypothetical protein VGI75_00240 [Pirellulales bacterium]
MSDQAHPGAVRLQSSAMVAAALITTLGAVTAACIQTGLISKSPMVTVEGFPASPQPSNFANARPSLASVEKFPTAREPRNPYVAQVEDAFRPAVRIAPASFVGTIEPLSEAPADNRKGFVPNAESTLTAPQSFTPGEKAKTLDLPHMVPSAEANTAAFLPVAAIGETQLTAGYAPALLPPDAPVKILPSPWSFLSSSTPGTSPVVSEKIVEPMKATKKSLD